MTIEMRVFAEIDENIYSGKNLEILKSQVLIGDGSLKLFSDNVEDEDESVPQMIGLITAVMNIKEVSV